MKTKQKTQGTWKEWYSGEELERRIREAKAEFIKKIDKWCDETFAVGGKEVKKELHKLLR